MVAGVLSLLLATTAAAQAPPEPSSKDKARTIIHQMIAAYGGMERWNSLRDASFAIRTLRYGVRPGRPVVSVTHIQFTKDPRAMIRLEARYATTTVAKVYDGQQAWIASDGYELERGDAARQQIRDRGKDILFWLMFPFNLVHPSVDADHLGTTHFMGTEVDVLQVTFRDDSIAVRVDDIYRFYVRRVDHLLLREEQFVHGRPETRIEVLYGEYRSVNGLLKDFLREIVDTTTGELMQRAEIEDLRFGNHVPRDLFVKPPNPLTAIRNAE